jgi:hypothetical protein
MENFDKKNIIERMMLKQTELEGYYRELRKYELENQNPYIGIKIRKKLNKLVVLIFKISTFLDGQKMEILNDKHTKSNTSKIYAVTHIGRYDIENSIKSIKENCYFVWGDPGVLYKSPEKILTDMLGTIFVDTDNKEDRHVCLETMCKLLNLGANIQIYPEGAWNLQKNEPVMKLYTGVIEAAIRTRSEIVPVAIEQYNKRYVINIGENVNLNNKSINDKRKLADDLRDIMCTLKWQIWEKEGIFKRKDIADDWYEKFVNDIMKDSDIGYTEEVIEKTRYKDKNITNYEEAFEFLKNIDINKNNLFLFENQDEVQREYFAKVLKK